VQSALPPTCPFTQVQLNIILDLLEITPYNVQMPLPESEFTTVEIVLPVPIIGPFTVIARRSGNELVFDPETIEDIDLSELGTLGFNCLVGGTASGSTSGFGNDSVQVTIEISDMSVTTGGGVGTCILTNPDPSCTLDVISVGTKQ